MKSEGGFVYLTAEEMAEADRVAIEDFGMDVLALMENAGAAVARLARQMLGGSVAGKRLVCLVGNGNNGGDGLVASRHLHNWGANMTLVLPGDGTNLRDVPAKGFETARRMGLEVVGQGTEMPTPELCIDALLGYNSKGNPREPMASLIRIANDSGVPILAVDLPSGLDATSGERGNPCIAAKATATLGLPKTGFLNPQAKTVVGELYVADISLPNELYRKFHQPMSMFDRDTLLRVW
ncbi:MAG: NAD(P)H-hydrate epimerase [Thaumarchaeota archaeon]|nr:NAD(P)H-hydrate epimerase [Nitrososphaerota archaeon]